MDKAGVFFAEGYEEIEALAVVDLLRRAEVETLMISVTDEKEVVGGHGISVRMDAGLSEINFEELTMLILPGGLGGTKGLEASAALMEQLDYFYENNKYIAAICAAPSILGHRGMLKGRKACSYPDFESHLEGAEITRDAVSIDGKIITSRGMGCAIDFGLALVQILKGKEAALKLAESIIKI